MSSLALTTRSWQLPRDSAWHAKKPARGSGCVEPLLLAGDRDLWDRRIELCSVPPARTYRPSQRFGDAEGGRGPECFESPESGDARRDSSTARPTADSCACASRPAWRCSLRRRLRDRRADRPASSGWSARNRLLTATAAGGIVLPLRSGTEPARSLERITGVARRLPRRRWKRAAASRGRRGAAWPAGGTRGRPGWCGRRWRSRSGGRQARRRWCGRAPRPRP